VNDSVESPRPDPHRRRKITVAHPTTIVIERLTDVGCPPKQFGFRVPSAFKTTAAIAHNGCVDVFAMSLRDARWHRARPKRPSKSTSKKINETSTHLRVRADPCNIGRVNELTASRPRHVGGRCFVENYQSDRQRPISRTPRSMPIAPRACPCYIERDPGRRPISEKRPARLFSNRKFRTVSLDTN